MLLTTSAEVWTTLVLMFASHLSAHVMQIRIQLENMKKNDSSAAEYFSKVKNLADTMASIGHALHGEEVVSYLLAGLGEEYNPLVMSLAQNWSPSTSYMHIS